MIQRRAALNLNPGRDPHDLAIGPPLEYGADRLCAHQLRRISSKRCVGFSRAVADHQLAIAVDFASRVAVPAGLALTTDGRGSTSKYSVARITPKDRRHDRRGARAKAILRTPLKSRFPACCAATGFDLDQMDADY